MVRDTKAALLDAARDRFATDGYAGTSIRAVAHDVGIKESSVYNHVASKQALLDAVVARAYARVASVAAEMGMSIDDPAKASDDYRAVDLGRLEQIADRFLEMWLHDPDVVAVRRILTLEQYRSPELGGALRSLTIEEPLAFQREIFARLMDNGGLRQADPDAVALAFWGPIHALMWAADAGSPEAESLARDRVALHLAHFRATHVREELS